VVVIVFLSDIQMVFLTLLFILLSPGFLLTIPPVGKRVLMSGQTSMTSVLVHALIFTSILYGIKYMQDKNKREGFAPQWNNETFVNTQIVAAVFFGISFACALGFMVSNDGMSMNLAMLMGFISIIMLVVGLAKALQKK